MAAAGAAPGLVAGLACPRRVPAGGVRAASLLDQLRRRTHQRNQALAALAPAVQDLFQARENILGGRPPGCAGSLAPALPPGTGTQHEPSPHRRGPRREPIVTTTSPTADLLDLISPA